MKRLSAAVALIAALIVGMLVTAPSASADCPYSACLATSASAKAKIKAGHRATIKVAVAAASNLAPTGQVTVKIVKRPGGKILTRTLPVKAGKVSLKTRALAPGKYTVTVTFVPAPGSVWQGTTTTTSFRVKKAARIARAAAAVPLRLSDGSTVHARSWPQMAARPYAGALVR